MIKNRYDIQDISEKMLKRLILEDMDSFLSELGIGFTYVGNEYKIKIVINPPMACLILPNVDVEFIMLLLKESEGDSSALYGVLCNDY